MAAIIFTSSGAFQKTEKKLLMMTKGSITKALEKFGQQGVDALKSVTPVDSSESANSWYYKIATGGGMWRLSWHNDNKIVTGEPLVLLIQYGHGTGTGGYVAGRDFINPAIKPIFDRIRAEIRREVTRK